MTPDQDMIVSEAELDAALIAQHGSADWKKAYSGAAIRLRTEDMVRALVAAGKARAIRPKEAGQAGEWVLVPREPTEAMIEKACAAEHSAQARGAQHAGPKRVYAAMLAAASPPPASPAVTVDDLAQEIRRVDGDNTLGAGRLAEALMSFLALTSPPGETAQVEATDDITVRLDNLAQSLHGEYPPHTLMDLAEAASLITTLRLSAKESPEQLREAVIEAATLLLERLDDFESELDGDDTYREYGGHVAPAKSRLRAALKETGK